jgi:hypothetical protein
MIQFLSIILGLLAAKIFVAIISKIYVKVRKNKKPYFDLHAYLDDED